MATSLSSPERQLARRTRERFAAEIGQGLAEVVGAIKDKLTSILEQVTSVREMQTRRDAWTAFQSHGQGWGDGTAAAWKRAALGPASTAQLNQSALTFELVGDEVVENKILASRIGLAIQDAVGTEYSDLCARIQQLEQGDELPGHDVLRPEALMLVLVEQWAAAGLARSTLPLISDVLQRELATHFRDAYKSCNEFLIACGVMPSVDLRNRVKRTDSAGAPGGAGGGASGGGRGQSSGWSQQGESDGARRGRDTAQPLGDDPERKRHLADGRMVTVTSPLARARRRAQGVLMQLKRVLSEQVSGFDATVAHELSPTLASAISERRGVIDPGMIDEDMAAGVYTPQAVSRVAGVLRDRSNELKRQASTTGEKATIEIVALMFQSILAEERIPPSVRVWFARLQLPVLRVALAEPEFFGTLNHPARQLIDRMGSCVMGFDSSAITGSAMENEIRRVVQVIEQYPETGRRVFQLVYDEFQKFLSKFLTEKGATLRVVSVAQQVEQKETLAIQYTIELRNMLKDIPVRDEIREFLFKIWAEVLAIAAVRKGAQDEETVALKRAAADLVWAASAKPNRADRARVIQSLPQLLQRLRQGMSLMGMASPDQEAHIKRISDTLADAFMSKTEAIPQARIEAMAARLANLEDFVSDESMGDLALDAESIEMMLGIDASSIDVIPDAGAKPSEAMMAWVQELQLGHWFTLDHNQKISQVQFAWRSERKQLHLFASVDGRSYLIQAKKLATYLQAGLLVPQEEEALTLRATRKALAKLDANPERLLAA